MSENIVDKRWPSHTAAQHEQRAKNRATAVLLPVVVVVVFVVVVVVHIKNSSLPGYNANAVRGHRKCCKPYDRKIRTTIKKQNVGWGKHDAFHHIVQETKRKRTKDKSMCKLN